MSRVVVLVAADLITQKASRLNYVCIRGRRVDVISKYRHAHLRPRFASTGRRARLKWRATSCPRAAAGALSLQNARIFPLSRLYLEALSFLNIGRDRWMAFQRAQNELACPLTNNKQDSRVCWFAAFAFEEQGGQCGGWRWEEKGRGGKPHTQQHSKRRCAQSFADKQRALEAKARGPADAPLSILRRGVPSVASHTRPKELANRSAPTWVSSSVELGPRNHT